MPTMHEIEDALYQEHLYADSAKLLNEARHFIEGPDALIWV